MMHYFRELNSIMTIQLTSGEFFCFVALGILQFALAKWIEGRIKESIRSEYAKVLEDYKYDIRVREQAAKIAEFFTEWVKGPNADKAKLNQYSMELSLWLPHQLYLDFAHCVTHAAGAPQYKDILISIRKHLLKQTSGDPKAAEIVHFA